MNVGDLIAEFVELNAAAKQRPLSDEESQRWTELKNQLIDAIAREPGPMEPKRRATG